MLDKAIQRSDCGCKDPLTDDEDATTEAAVLRLVLEEHPAQFTGSELKLEMCGSVEDFGESDAVERAVQGLVGAGLLHRQGTLVLPSRAALYLDGLPLD